MAQKKTARKPAQKPANARNGKASKARQGKPVAAKVAAKKAAKVVAKAAAADNSATLRKLAEGRHVKAAALKKQYAAKKGGKAASKPATAKGGKGKAEPAKAQRRSPRFADQQVFTLCSRKRGATNSELLAVTGGKTVHHKLLPRVAERNGKRLSRLPKEGPVSECTWFLK